MLKSKYDTNGNCGAVIPLVMFVLVLMLVIGAGMITLGWYGRLLGVRTGSNIAARCAADAGLSKAIAEMNDKLKTKPWDADTLPAGTAQALPNSEAVYSYVVTDDGSSTYRVQTVGKCAAVERNIDSTLRLAGPFEYAVFARDYIEFKAKTTVDWYNFDADDWALKVGTNSIAAGAITLKNDTSINGDLVVGPEGDPSVAINAFAGVTVTGRTYAMTEQQQLQTVTVPQWLENMPSQGTIKNSATISSSGRYDGIKIGTNKVITIDEPVSLYVTGDIVLGNGAKFIIGGAADDDHDASLIMYLAGNIEAKNSSGFTNETKDASKFELYALDSCSSIDIKNDGDFCGAIYAPDAHMVLRNSGDVYGSIIADSFELKNAATIYYDTALRHRTEADQLVHFVVKRWSEH